MSVGVVDKQTGDRIPTAGMPAIDDALSAISTNPVQNAIITAALANKQDKTDNSLQTTDKTVVGAVNELKSGLTNYETQNDLNLEVQNRKNLLPITLEGIKAISTYGRWNGNEYTYGGVTFTIVSNADGYVEKIIANGTAQNTIYFRILNNLSLPKGKYILSGVSGGSTTTYCLTIYAQGVWKGLDLGSGLSIEVTDNYTPTFTDRLEIVFNSGYEAKDIVFTPMVRPSFITDPTFVPYIPSVDARLDAVESGLTNKANVAIYHMGGGQTVNIEHTNIVAIMSDRGGLYTDGIANRGINDLVPSTQITVTHVDAAHVTVTNNSQYGTSILVLSDGDITMTPVQ